MWLHRVVVASLCVFLPTVACIASDKPADLESALALFDAAHWSGKADTLMKEVAAEQLQQRTVSVKVGFDFAGNDAGPQDQFKAATAVEIARGTFPHEFRLKLRSDVLYTNSSLQENVTDGLVNYDYHPHPRIEVYAFTQRFANTFLSIKDRYEIGVGGRVRLYQRAPAVTPTTQLIETFPVAAFQDRIKHESGMTPQAASTAARFAAALPGLQSAIADRKSPFELDFAVSVLHELEQAEITSQVTSSAAGPTTQKFLLDASHRARIVARPSARWRPTDLLTVSGVLYLKYPLARPIRESGELDWRSDASVLAEFAVTQDGKVTIATGYELHFDNAPPRLSQATIEEVRAGGGEVVTTVAQKTHRAYIMQLQLKF